MKVAYKFDPFEIAGVDPSGLSKADKLEILDDVSDIVITSVLEYVGSANSPVSGRGKFAPLDEKYAEKEHGGDRNAKLELSGDLLGSLIVIKNGDSLVLTVPEEEQGKADGHNDFSGDSNLPTRRFIPNGADAETFKKSILNDIREHVRYKINGI